MLRWLRRRREDAQLSQRRRGRACLRGSPSRLFRSQRQQDAHNSEIFAHWWRVAQAIAKRMGHPIGLDTAPKMPAEADPVQPSLVGRLSAQASNGG